MSKDLIQQRFWFNAFSLDSPILKSYDDKNGENFIFHLAGWKIAVATLDKAYDNPNTLAMHDP